MAPDYYKAVGKDSGGEVELKVPELGLVPKLPSCHRGNQNRLAVDIPSTVRGTAAVQWAEWILSGLMMGFILMVEGRLFHPPSVDMSAEKLLMSEGPVMRLMGRIF